MNSILNSSEMVLFYKQSYDAICTAAEIYKEMNFTKSPLESIVRGSRAYEFDYDLGSFGKFRITKTNWSFRILKIKSSKDPLQDGIKEEVVSIGTRLHDTDSTTIGINSQYMDLQNRFIINFVDHNSTREFVNDDETHTIRDFDDIESFLFQCSTIMGTYESVSYALACSIGSDIENFPFSAIALAYDIVEKTYINLQLQALLHEIRKCPMPPER